jgi:septation ring formation regulator EzrA
MGRPKKEIIVPEGVELEEVEIHEAVEEINEESVAIPQRIIPLSIDYTSEALNDMARKINEIIAYVNEK